jgi:hypothetical protein
MGTCARAARVCGFVLVLGLGVCVFLARSAAGQDAGKAPAPLRASVASNVGRGCGGSVAPAAIQEAVAARLTAGGIVVSKVHNAKLSLDVDCAAPAPNSHKRTMAVQECLTLFELASAPSKEGKATLASTWRKCQSYTCNRPKCEVSERYGAQLMEEFLNDFRERSSGDQVSRAQSRSQPNSGVAAVQSISAAQAAPRVGPCSFQHSTDTPVDTVRVVIYAAYILTCISVFVYWQFRNRGSLY